jgi:hypothetical protein
VKYLIGNPQTLDDYHSDSEVEWDYSGQMWPDLKRIVPDWRSDEASDLLERLENMYKMSVTSRTRTAM